MAGPAVDKYTSDYAVGVVWLDLVLLLFWVQCDWVVWGWVGCICGSSGVKLFARLCGRFTYTCDNIVACHCVVLFKVS